LYVVCYIYLYLKGGYIVKKLGKKSNITEMSIEAYACICSCSCNSTCSSNCNQNPYIAATSKSNVSASTQSSTSSLNTTK